LRRVDRAAGSQGIGRKRANDGGDRRQQIGFERGGRTVVKRRLAAMIDDWRSALFTCAELAIPDAKPLVTTVSAAHVVCASTLALPPAANGRKSF
jgi:hypothetical protein